MQRMRPDVLLKSRSLSSVALRHGARTTARACAPRWLHVAARSNGKASTTTSPLRPIAVSVGSHATMCTKATVKKGESLCCPQCGSTLQLAESLAEASLPAAKATAVPMQEARAFKEGDVVKCRGCNLHFAVKAASTARASTPSAATPTYRNAAAAAALNSLSSSTSSLLGGTLQVRSSSIGSGSSSTTITGGSSAASTVHRRRMNADGEYEKLANEALSSSSGGSLGRRPSEFLEQRLLTPREIYDGLNQYVIGQDHVKRILSVGVHNHYKRLQALELLQARRKRDKGVMAKKARRRSRNSNSGCYLRRSGVDGLVHTAEDSTENEAQQRTLPSQDDLEPESVVSSTSLAMLERLHGVGTGQDQRAPRGTHRLREDTISQDASTTRESTIVIADATCLTQAGYVGEDVESVLFKLYQASNYNLEATQRGIVYIDEIDKISRKKREREYHARRLGEGRAAGAAEDAGRQSRQRARERGRKNPRGEYITIDTTNILFICGGASSHVARSARPIGFGATMRNTKLQDSGQIGSLLQRTDPEDLVSFGMIPEFIGRFPLLVSTTGLTQRELVQVLTEPKNSLVRQYQALFALNGVEFHATDGALDAVAELALKRNTGARGLRSIFERALIDTMFELPDRKDVSAVVVDEDAVLGRKKPVLLRHGVTVDDYLKQQQQQDEEAVV
ncbi:hypothetical protein PINS_up019683 [Pythium insidiosum]|nr:hypothetical protein PINS_up019683 [Pythium insidiosum]